MVQMRSCIACRNRESSKGLLHLVAIDGQVTPDPDRELHGRGAWLHPRCFELATQRHSFTRAFKSREELGTIDLEDFLKRSLTNERYTNNRLTIDREQK